MKKLLYSLPEVFFIGLAIYWMLDNYNANKTINYFAIVFIAIMIFQVIYSRKILGLVSGIILCVISLFMVLAVRSEHNDFPVGSAEGLKFLLIGEGLFLFSAFIAGTMVFRYTMQKPEIPPVKHSAS